MEAKLAACESVFVNSAGQSFNLSIKATPFDADDDPQSAITVDQTSQNSRGFTNRKSLISHDLLVEHLTRR